MKNAFFLFLVVGFLAGCGGPSSYEQGKEAAEKLYGAQTEGEMMGQMNEVMQKAQKELEETENKKEWWNGFCDRGEEIWLERVDEMNEKMGQKVLNRDQIKSMFSNMRSSFRE
ncbi:hypothetical protein ACFL2O_00270 [Thermodesulfobacteriota bacterium]